MRPISRLLFFYGLLIPLPMAGVPLNEVYVLSFAAIVGFLYAVLFLRSFGSWVTHVSCAAMLLAFLATAVFRHSPGSYLLSLGALALSAAPLTAPFLDNEYAESFRKGLLRGFQITVTWVGLSISLQITGLDLLAGPLQPSLVHPEAGSFMGYYRPIAGFSEPSHLALYLCFMYAYFDIGRTAQRPYLTERVLSALAVLASGSVSGLLTLIVYFVGKHFRITSLSAVHRGLQPIWRRWAISALGFSLMLYLAIELSGVLGTEYMTRIAKAYEDALGLNLVGSEGSRVNALLALPDYWSTQGWSGVLFGTGYANYKNWLVNAYGDLGEFASFARGDIDSAFVAILLSTGILGFFFYLRFVSQALGSWHTRDNLSIVFIFIAFNFSYGFLISGLYWACLFIIAVAIRNRMAPQEDKLEPVQARGTALS